MKKIIFMMILLALFSFGCSKTETANIQSKNGLPVVRVAHQPAYHALPTWLGIQKGWAKEAGISVDFKSYTAGGDQVAALGKKEWDIGVMGAAPSLLAALRYDSYIIAISNDESQTNDLWVRPDSPLLQNKGANPKYPDIYGSPEDYKGKIILTTSMSTGHFATLATLKAMGVNSNEVKIVNTDQGQAFKFFEEGQGDIVQFWAPSSYKAEEKGWVKVSSGKAAGAKVLGLVVADKDFADQNPALVNKWLEMYIRGLKEMKKNPVECESALYDYYNNSAKMNISEEMIQKEFELRPVFDLNEQLSLFNVDAKNNSPLISNMQELATFFEEQGRITARDKEKLEKNQFNVTDKFLKNLQKGD